MPPEENESQNKPLVPESPMDRNARMYEPYLRGNEKQSYLWHAVLFGFFVQLNHKYTDTVQKLPTNSESNIMRRSSVPRFKCLPISAPALYSRGTTAKTSMPTSSSRSTWKASTNGELSRSIDLDDKSSFGVAVPILKSSCRNGSLCQGFGAMPFLMLHSFLEQLEPSDKVLEVRDRFKKDGVLSDDAAFIIFSFIHNLFEYDSSSEGIPQRSSNNWLLS